MVETNLTRNNVLELNGFKWFGNNRKRLHKMLGMGLGELDFLFVMIYF